FMPIQNVIDAPATDPNVASSGTIQGLEPPRAERTTTIASMPSGSQKNVVESSAARTITPIGDPNSASSHWVKPRTAGSKQEPFSARRHDEGQWIRMNAASGRTGTSSA